MHASVCMVQLAQSSFLSGADMLAIMHGNLHEVVMLISYPDQCIISIEIHDHVSALTRHTSRAAQAR